MLFVISGRVTPDVGLESGRLSKKFQREILRLLLSVELTSSLKGIVLFPTILNPDIASLSDSVTYKRKEGSVFVALEISHAQWINASLGERIDLLANNIRMSVEKITGKHLVPADRAKLLDVIDRATLTLKRNSTEACKE
jgi:hypothetical protein